MSDVPHTSLFIELDALLDTRISLINSLGEEALEKALNNDYHNRLLDEFPTISHSDFKELYNKRDKTILTNSMITPMIELIREFIGKTLTQIKITPFNTKPKVIINTYPYILSDDETQMILSAVITTTEGLCDIDVVHMTYEEITPSYVRGNLSYIILYECYRWLEIHSLNEAFKKTTCPHIALIGPALYSKPIDKSVKLSENPFKDIEKLAGPLINLQLVSIEMFSLIVKVKQKD